METFFSHLSHKKVWGDFLMKTINHLINFLLALIKWPIALLMLVLLVPAFLSDIILIREYLTSSILFQFFLPFTATVFLFLLIPGLAGSFLAIAEHELTHMLFAVLTFHKPKGLDINQDVGGSFSFVGEGNWLIALAPYFFPTFTFIVMIGAPLYLLFFEKLPSFYLTLLGVLIGYHFISSLLSIHPKQTDFKVAGYIFTICFLPGINLIVYGILFCFVIRDWSGISLYFNMLGYQTSLFLQKLLSF